MRFLFGCFLLITCTQAFGQSWLSQNGLPENVSDPPSTLPSGCSATEITHLDGGGGSSAFVALRYQIAALEYGHKANREIQSLMASHGHNSQSGSIQADLTERIVGLDEAKNNYLCASFIIGRMTTNDENYSALRKILLSVYNRFAKQAVLIKEQYEQFAEDAESNRPTPQVASAKSVSAIIEDHKEAAGDLKDTMHLTSLLSLDGTGPANEKIEFFAFSCSEKSDLLVQIKDLSKEVDPDEFTNSAHLLQIFLEMPYKCHVS